MRNLEAEDGRIQQGVRLSCQEFSTEALKRFIQLNIQESENGNPREIEIIGDEQTLYISHSIFRLVNALPPRYKETHSRFFELVDYALENATHMIIRGV